MTEPKVTIDYNLFYHITGVNPDFANWLGKARGLTIPARNTKSDYLISEVLFYQIFDFAKRQWGQNKALKIFTSFKNIQNYLAWENYLIIDLASDNGLDICSNLIPVHYIDGKPIGQFLYHYDFMKNHEFLGEVVISNKLIANIQAIKSIILTNSIFLADKSNRDRICYVHQNNYFVYDELGNIKKTFDITDEMQKLKLSKPGKYMFDDLQWRLLMMSIPDWQCLPNGSDYIKPHHRIFPNYSYQES